MAHFQCEKCSAVMVAESTPESCTGCGAPAKEAYPYGPAASHVEAARPVEHLFDVGAPAAAPPPAEEGARKARLRESQTMELEEQDLEDTGLKPSEVPPVVVDGELALAPQTTLELNEQDLEQARPRPSAAPPLSPVTTLELDERDLEPPASPPPEVPPLSPVTTLELDERDLEQPASPPPTPRSFKPLPGRVAYPVGREPAARFTPVEVDETAAAGLPPPPPRQPRELSSQTESLRGLRARKHRRTTRAVLIVVACGAGIGLAIAAGFGLLGRGPAPVDVVDGGAGPPDLGLDLRRADLPGRDLVGAPDRARPDSAAAQRPRPPRPPASSGVAPQRPSPPVSMDADALYSAGLRALLSGELDRAITQFNQAIKRDRRKSLAYRGLGLAYEKLGRKSLAKEAFARYLALRPDAPDAAAIRKRMAGL